MSPLKRLSIIQLSILSAAVFSLLVIVLVAKDVYNNYLRYQASQEDVTLVSLLDALEKVAHNHAVERGLTAGFLAAPSSPRKAKVDAQRKKADASANNLTNLLKQTWPESYGVQQKTSVLVNHLRGKSSLRREVDAEQGKNAFSYYSALNQYALDAAQSLTINISNPKVSYDLTAALYFANAKERLGQIRGKANGVLAKRAISLPLQKEIAGFVAEKTKVFNYLDNILAGESQVNFNAINSSQKASQFNNIVKELLSAEPNFDSLPQSSDWFGLATSQIGQVKKLLDAQWLAIKNEAKNSTNNAWSGLLTMLVGTSIAVLIIFYINYVLVKSLKSELSQLTKNLDKIADEGDLTIDVRLKSSNELGMISRSINKTIYALKDLIVGLSTSISTTTRLSQRLDDATLNILEDADQTQHMATSIATAVEEMSQTSVQIADSAVQALEASAKLDTSADQALALNRQTKDAISGLNSHMETAQSKASTMEQKVTEIGSILDTINTLSEQTNLLALNAAIEAARAGEHGRGFAVVADEVRTLAQGSRQSSDKISNLLNELQQVSFDVIEGINKNAESVTEVLEFSVKGEETANQVKEHANLVEQMSATVSAAAEEQSVTSRQVAEDVGAVQVAATREFELAQELREIFDDTEINNTTLQRTMDNFHIE